MTPVLEVILKPSLRTHLSWCSGTSEISTPSEIAAWMTSMHKHGTKTTPAFLPADGEASWSLFPSSVSLLSGGTVQTENTYSLILKVTGQVWESLKRISINTTHSHHQHSAPSVSFNWYDNKARFSFKQPDRKRWGAKLVDVKYLPLKAFLL